MRALLTIIIQGLPLLILLSCIALGGCCMGTLAVGIGQGLYYHSWLIAFHWLAFTAVSLLLLLAVIAIGFKVL